MPFVPSSNLEARDASSLQKRLYGGYGGGYGYGDDNGISSGARIGIVSRLPVLGLAAARTVTD